MGFAVLGGYLTPFAITFWLKGDFCNMTIRDMERLLPSEYNTYADIKAVYQCLQTEYGVGQEDLILYGQSVGSSPTLHLAAHLPRLRGVVLHSAILSGLRVVCHVKFSFCFDIYKNIDKIIKVKCPVFVIHYHHCPILDERRRTKRRRSAAIPGK
ncbi:Endomembrane protein 70 [Musa troglodytarum]|uniref:Endomembrane protein 70 n=1 Tax=Musa troglodytarum TaxID=320322 RepID=A0A9E7L007_9LILI|nr:Endomembrane protein 70 [Musa troglodytarum]